MIDEALERAVAESRMRTMNDLRAALRDASPATLEKIAAGIVPLLFRNDYTGEPAGKGDHHGDAVAVSRSPALPSFFVRVHRGTFEADDVDALRKAVMTAQVTQAALAVIADKPMTVATREALGTIVPWLLDTDGLAHMMLNANLGVTARTLEVKNLDGTYFR